MLREEEQLMTQFSDLPVTIISNFQLGYLLKTIILFEILQTKIMRMITLQILYVGLVPNDKIDFIQSKNLVNIGTLFTSILYM